MANNGNGLLRPRYVERQQLTAADLNLGQNYLRERLRRHNRALHGWGVVCGATVSGSEGSPWQVQVAPGYGLTPQGDEVVIPADAPPFDIQAGVEACLGAPDPCAEPGAGAEPVLTCVNFMEMEPDTEGPNPVTFQGAVFTGWRSGVIVPRTRIEGWGEFVGFNCFLQTTITLPQAASAATLTLMCGAGPVLLEAFDIAGALVDSAQTSGQGGQAEMVRLSGGGITNITITAPQNETLLLQICWETTAGDLVYLVVYPDEELTCSQPLVPAKCAPPGSSYDYTRVREGYRLEIVCCLPDSHQQGLTCEQLEAIVCGQTHVPCPPALDADDNGLVLATITVGSEGIETIDDWTDRRRLLNGWLLQEYVRCRCQEAPPPPGRIDAIQPTQVEGNREEPIIYENVRILGQGLSGAMEVAFLGGGVSANIVSSTPTEITLLLTVFPLPQPIQIPFLVLFADGRPALNSADFGVFLFVTLPQQPTGIPPTGIIPTGIIPTGIIPTGIIPTGIIPTGIIPTGIIPTGIIPTGIIPTGIIPTGITPTGILPTGILPTGIIGTRPPLEFGFDPQEFDLVAGAMRPVEDVLGVGEVRGDKLRQNGITSVLEFAALPVDRAAQILGISEVRVAELKNNAIGMMRRG